MIINNNIKKISLILIIAIGLTSCATNRFAQDPKDPLEPFNRSMHAFNKTVDKLYIKPVSKTYELILPKALRNLVSNFFSNLGEIPTILNNLLQAKFKEAGNSTNRFVINSTLGIGGLFDLASNINLPHEPLDFGKTLAAWGYRKSTYIVLPILGPSTIRDTIGIAGNTFLSVPYYLEPKWRNRYEALYIVDKRSNLQQLESFINNIGVDKYKAVRNSFLQNRNYMINELDEQPSTELLEEPPE